MSVFLGGSCGLSNWREQLIPKLTCSYFNPVVKDNWTEEDKLQELQQREVCNFVLYVLSPFMKGIYSVAELIDDSNKQPEKTLFLILGRDRDKDGRTYVFQPDIANSVRSVADMAIRNGAKEFKSLDEVVLFLNNN